jgi:hypothetical protein
VERPAPWCGAVRAGQFVDDPRLDQAADTGVDSVGGQSCPRRGQLQGRPAERPQDAQRRGHRTIRLAQRVHCRDERIVVRQHWYRRPRAKEGVAVGDPDPVPASPAREQGVDCSRDATGQLAYLPGEDGVGLCPQPPRDQRGDVIRSQRGQLHRAGPLDTGQPLQEPGRTVAAWCPGLSGLPSIA